jgi:hypothetical protein
MSHDNGATLGQFIAARLVEVGCTDYFGVPGNVFLRAKVLKDLNVGNLQRFCSPLLPFSLFNISGE